MQQPQWEKINNGIWGAQLGSSPGPGLLAHADVAPKTQALEKLADRPFPLAQEAIALSRAGSRLVLTMPLQKDETLYGLGLNFQHIEVQQTIRHLKVDHYGGQDNGRTHAPVPFYVSGNGYGVFVDLAAPLSIYAGGTHRKEHHPPVIDRLEEGWKPVYPGRMVEIVLPEPGAQVLVFAGPTPLAVVQRFNLYCGGGCLPPRWGLGFWHRVPSAYRAVEAAAEVDEFARRGFPLDVLGLEPGWHSQSYPTSYEWHPERFPEPARFIDDMHAQGVRVNLWENGYVAPDCPLGRRIEPHCGSHTGGWGGLIPDLSLAQARTLLAQQHETAHFDKGVSGYKLDECDGYDQWIWPDHATFPSGLSGDQLRQVYGLLYQRTTAELYRRNDRRTYGLVRASNAGSVSLPYVLYNDYYDHRGFITALCSASFCGLLWTPEARSSQTAEEWLRRIQAVCLSPLAMINAWADGTKPWSFPEVEEAVRQVMLVRMRLIPYLYTAFAQYRETGVPPVRAMVLDEAFDPSVAADVKDQYLLGPSLLVAPAFSGETERTVVLPQGRWYDFYSGACCGEGPGTVEIEAPSERISLLVRDGGIIPLMPPLLQAPGLGQTVDLELRHYGQAEGTFALYDDDGETYAYEQGACRWTSLRVRSKDDGQLEGFIESSPGAQNYTYGVMEWRFMS